MDEVSSAPPPARSDLALRLGVGLLISGVLLALVFHGVDRDEFLAAWSGVSLAGLGAVLLVHGLSIVLRITRWRALLEVSDCSPGDEAPAGLVAHSALFGWLMNLVVPGRVGELARPLMYSRGSGRPFPRVLGTSVVERAADLAVVALLGVAALTLLPGAELLPPWLRGVVLAGAGIAAAALLLCLVLARTPEGVQDRPPAGITGMVLRLREGFSSVRQPRAAVRLALESLGIWLLEVLAVWIALWSFGLDAPLNLAFAHVVAVTLAVSVATLPLGLGVEQLTTVKLLAFWGISQDDALSLSLALSFVAFAWVVPGGLWGWWRQGSRKSGPGSS